MFRNYQEARLGPGLVGKSNDYEKSLGEKGKAIGDPALFLTLGKVALCEDLITTNYSIRMKNRWM